MIAHLGGASKLTREVRQRPRVVLTNNNRRDVPAVSLEPRRFHKDRPVLLLYSLQRNVQLRLQNVLAVAALTTTIG